MLIQFYKDSNTLKVFKDHNSSAILVIRGTVRAYSQELLGFRAKSSDWVRTSWGSEIELELKVKRTGKASH